MSTAPFEIMAAPYEVWVAPATEAEDDVSAAPSGNWVKLGASGAKNISEDGVTVTLEQTIEKFRPVGLTAARKAFRTEEEVMVEFTLMDMDPAMLTYAVNAAAVTDTAAGSGVGAQESVDLLRGFDVDLVSLIIKSQEAGDSPLAVTGAETWYSQYYIPVAYQAASPAIVHKKGEPAGLSFNYSALWDSTNGFGHFTAQDGNAS